MKHSSLAAAMITESDQAESHYKQLFESTAWLGIIDVASGIRELLENQINEEEEYKESIGNKELYEDNTFFSEAALQKTITVGNSIVPSAILISIIDLALIGYSNLIEKYEEENGPLTLDGEEV